ncbi:KTSC domain-containing protein [Streptomyces sp. 5.8]|uniref:KTSC domain-containing protein n=1 Tax=Streptomyces sp. 5.8 TaxID=3406571 RepID=UPI003BB56E38
MLRPTTTSTGGTEPGTAPNTGNHPPLHTRQQTFSGKRHRPSAEERHPTTRPPAKTPPEGPVANHCKSHVAHHYENVPADVHAALMASSSKGGFLARFIKGRYPYRPISA